MKGSLRLPWSPASVGRSRGPTGVRGSTMTAARPYGKARGRPIPPLCAEVAAVSVLWNLADEFGVIPMRTPEPLRALIADWWAAPRVFGCHRMRGDWFVVAPDVAVYCGACAALRLRRETCCVCGHDAVRHDAEVIVAADRHVRFLALNCSSCNTTTPTRGES